MAIEIRKQDRENNQSLVRRFSKRLKQSGVLLNKRKTAFYKREKSAQMKKKAILRRLEKREEYAQAVKLGKK